MDTRGCYSGSTPPLTALLGAGVWIELPRSPLRGKARRPLGAHAMPSQALASRPTRSRIGLQKPSRAPSLGNHVLARENLAESRERRGDRRHATRPRSRWSGSPSGSATKSRSAGSRWTSGRRVLLAPGPVGIGQDDDPSPHRRLRATDQRHRPAARTRRHQRAALRARRQHGLPGLRPLSAHDGW